MGEVIVHVGELGQGQKVKVISNAVAAINCATLAQALVVGKRRGRGPARRSLEVIGAGVGQLDHASSSRAGPMLDARLHDAVPARAHAQGRLHLPGGDARPPASRSRRRRWPASSTAPALGRGLGEQDFAAVLEAVEGLAGIRL